MSEADTQRTAEGEARAAEHAENLAMADARRAEEEVAKAHAEAEAAEEKEEKLSRKERRAREKAARVHAEADRIRAQADAAQATTATVSGAGDAGSTAEPAAAQRTEVLVGAAFVGSFLAARVLKRIFD